MDALRGLLRRILNGRLLISMCGRKTRKIFQVDLIYGWMPDPFEIVS